VLSLILIVMYGASLRRSPAATPVLRTKVPPV